MAESVDLPTSLGILPFRNKVLLPSSIIQIRCTSLQRVWTNEDSRGSFRSLLSFLAHWNPSPSIPIITAYTTGYGRNSRGMEIFCKSWLPKVGDQIKGIAKRIAASGYTICTLDLTCFGLFEGLHGYIPNFDELVDDVIEQFTNVKRMKLLNLDSSDILHNIGFANFFELIATPGRSEVKGLPFFVMGESMGGAVSLKIHIKEPDKWDGVIVVAPICNIARGLHCVRVMYVLLRSYLYFWELETRSGTNHLHGRGRLDSFLNL